MAMLFPHCWCVVQLSDLGEIVTGKTPSTKNSQNFGGDIPFIKPGDLDGGGYVENTVETLSKLGASTVPTLPANSIAITCIGNLGKIGITSRTSATNQQINSVIPSSRIDYKYLYYQISTLKLWMQENASATTVTIINKGKFSKAPIVLCSLAEQKAIADKLDTLLAQVETTKARLERIPDILKRFRQSVLAAAVSGQLDKCSGEMVSGWEATTLGSISLDIRYGTSKKCAETGGGMPVLRIPNIGNGVIIQNKLKYAGFDKKEIASLALESGDILMIRSNGSLELVGKTALVRENEKGYLYAGYLIRLRLDQNRVVPRYVEICLRSPQLRAVIEETARSTSGVNNINSRELAGLNLILPPQKKQTQIACRVDQLFAHADRIEQQAQAALERVNKLTQSILAKAFRGELTEQWRRDHPELIAGENSAAALLERIKAERATSGKPKARKSKA